MKNNKKNDVLDKLLKKSKIRRQNKKPQNPFTIVVIVLLVIMATVQIFGTQINGEKKISEKTSISNIIQLYEEEKLAKVLVKRGEVVAETKDGKKYLAYKLPNETSADLGLNKNIKDTEVSVSDTEADAFWGNLISSLLPIIIIFLIIIFLMRRAGGGNGGFGFGASKAKLSKEEDSKTKFKDVAGCDEAKEELIEIVDFLKKPKKYTKIGAKIPKGVLMVGSPGTGKTLMARAVAGEAGVPFFTISGSEFIEMFVGVGASRVRDLFEKAKKVAPAIIFIDEIDAIGKQRGQGFGGGHDEREQTLNQILTEMDGFDNTTSVIVLAATNRPDVLDKALLRPGRFDRRVMIDMPDLEARLDILKVHSQNKPLQKKMDLKDIARKTPGFSGAELESVMNEAAIAAAKNNKKTISQKDLFEAVEKVMMGPEKKSKKSVEKEKIITAYHEVGHALVSHLIPECDPVHKISIIARGMSLGSTWYLPEEDNKMQSKSKFEAELCSLVGGRLAEKIKFGENEITTGASNDLERASEIARKMVKNFGMSNLGYVTFSDNTTNQSFMGVEQSKNSDYSEKTAEAIDQEVKQILDQAIVKAEKLITDNLDLFEKITQTLLKKEVLTADEFQKFFNSPKNS